MNERIQDPRSNDHFFDGETLYGDDLSPAEIEQWYRDEEEAYFALSQKIGNIDRYEYDAFNDHYGFSKIRNRKFEACLAFGCADGSDVKPIADIVEQFIALEPAEQWWSDNIGGTPARFIKPSVQGHIPLEDNAVDLAVCLGVMHHIPNVSFVLSEVGRVSRSGAILLLREPIFSMGNWTQPRRLLTAHERGIPAKLLMKALEAAGFEILSAKYCMNPVSAKLATALGFKTPYNSKVVTMFDRLLSIATGWNMKYHRTSPVKKVAPTSVFITARKK